MSQNWRVGTMGIERMVCRRFTDGVGRWTLKDEEPKYAPDKTCDVEHLRLALDVDLPHKHLSAVCTLRLRAAYGPFRTIALDAVDLRIGSIRDGSGRALDHVYLGRRLTVHFPIQVEDTVDLVIAYEVDHPALGLYFIEPEDSDPDAPWQLWSQGEDEEARYWIPCHDAPNEKMTTEMIVSVDRKYTVISNGELRDTQEQDGKKIYHWFESVPHVSYLITLVVGQFVRVVDQWRGIPVDYYIEPGREEEARRSFGKTPRMIEFFSGRLDHPYPYEKYSQIAVRRFHFGGMENTSATTQTDGTLHDDRAALDFTSDELVAHELAHQWFGDLLTCKSWAHAWLNEGFATYFEALWKEEDLGRDEFDYEMILNAAGYMADPYRRAIVSNRYAFPHELFDGHLYPKGGWVLHMLRRRLGDDLFWKAMRTYIKRHEKACVETIDLIRAFEEASGKNLSGFFDQWVLGPGHPEIEGSISWEEEEERVRVSLKQVQKTEGGVPAVFRIPVRVECGAASGLDVGMTFEMDQPEQTFYLALPKKPRWVVLDPDQAVLGTWKVGRPSEWLEATLSGEHRHPRVAARIDAIRQLGEKPGRKAEDVLGRVCREDPFWGVAAEAAHVLAKIRSPHSLEILLGAVNASHPKVRLAVVQGLGAYRSRTAADALRGILNGGDASWFVEATAASALGRTGQDGAATLLRNVMTRPSWHDLIAMHAAAGLAALREESALDDLLRLAADRRRYWNCRVTTMRSLAEMGAARPNLAPRIAEEVSRFLEDPAPLIASRTAGALVALGHESGVGALRRAAAATPDPRMANGYLMAADRLASQRKHGEDVDRLRDEVEKLRSEGKELREALQRLELKIESRPMPNGRRLSTRKATRSRSRSQESGSGRPRRSRKGRR